MLTTNEKKSLLRVLVAGSCSAIITMAALTVDVNATSLSPHATTGSATGTCLYSAQLASDPAVRNEYTTRIAMTKWGLKEESDEEIYESDLAAGNAFAARFAGTQGGLDSFSNECLVCHDGVMAQNFIIRIKNNPDNRVMSLEDIIGGHPVGMEFDRYLNGSKGKEYRSDVKFTSEAVFAEGKIGCLTCHNPLNTAKGHLVMQNEKSELCFSCHGK
ncbi:MAG: hypothetical protein FIA91_03350 [Geobacter sp.]|nr:hypothetical protein [Geobacter sp.]